MLSNVRKSILAAASLSVLVGTGCSPKFQGEYSDHKFFHQIY